MKIMKECEILAQSLGITVLKGIQKMLVSKLDNSYFFDTM